MFNLAELLRERLGLGSNQHAAPARHQSEGRPVPPPVEQEGRLMAPNKFGFPVPAPGTMDSPIAKDVGAFRMGTPTGRFMLPKSSSVQAPRYTRPVSPETFNPQSQNYGQSTNFATGIQGIQNPGYTPFHNGAYTRQIQDAYQYDRPLQGGNYNF